VNAANLEGSLRLVSLPGVFSPISDSWQLAAVLCDAYSLAGADVLDLCTGSGVLAVTAATHAASVTAVDVSRRAVLTTRFNALLNGVRVRALHGDLFEPVHGERFDIVVSNPPYVPSPDPHVPTRGASRAWAAGENGRLVLDRICDDVHRHLRPGGVFLVVHSSLIDENATTRRLAASGMHDAGVVERVRGGLGPLMKEQQRRGTVPSDIDIEDVVVIRATAG
jgi:release factor glutamine methyltransferase